MEKCGLPGKDVSHIFAQNRRKYNEKTYKKKNLTPIKKIHCAVSIRISQGITVYRLNKLGQLASKFQLEKILFAWAPDKFNF